MRDQKLEYDEQWQEYVLNLLRKLRELIRSGVRNYEICAG